MMFKIIFTLVVAFFAWKLFSFVLRVQNKRDKDGEERLRDNEAKQDGVEDMIECPVCKTYTPRGSKPCGKEGCPFEN